MKTPDDVVVGLGAMGSATTYQLAKAAYRLSALTGSLHRMHTGRLMGTLELLGRQPEKARNTCAACSPLPTVVEGDRG